MDGVGGSAGLVTRTQHPQVGPGRKQGNRGGQWRAALAQGEDGREREVASGGIADKTDGAEVAPRFERRAPRQNTKRDADAPGKSEAARVTHGGCRRPQNKKK